MNYIDEVRLCLHAELPGLDDELIDLYSLLVLTHGQRTTLEHIHDAWSVWRSRTHPDHRSVVPFAELSAEVQELDRKYARAVIYVAIRLGLR